MNDQDKWLNMRTVECQRFHARLTPEACRRHAQYDPQACAGCQMIKPAAADGGKRLCSIQGCGQPHYASDLCRKHYARRRYVNRNAGPAKKVCQVEGCEEPHSAKGFCKMHYQRLIAHPRQAKKSTKLTLDFSGKEAALLARLTRMAASNGNTIEDEAIIYIEACLDYYEERSC